MKKIYIKPENVVVAVNVKEHLMESSPLGYGGQGGDGSRGEAREVVRQDIKSQDAWEEW